MNIYDVILIPKKMNRYKPVYFIEECKFAPNKIVVAELQELWEGRVLVYGLSDIREIISMEAYDGLIGGEVENIDRVFMEDVLALSERKHFNYKNRIEELRKEQSSIKNNMLKKS